MSKAERERIWEARSAEFKASEMNGSKWCKEHDPKPGVTLITFVNTRNGHRRYS
jgi:hypothetical protein